MVSAENHPRENGMHPMFVELFIETDLDDLDAEEQRRRALRPRRRRAQAVRSGRAAGRSSSRGYG